MSILLEALRKSENNQKPIEPPNIHRNDHPVDASGPIKGSHVAVLIVIALAIIGWLLWQQYQPEASSYKPPVDLPAGKSGNRLAQTPIDGKSTVDKTSKQSQSKPAANKAPQQPVSKASGGARTPVETYQMSKQEKIAATQARKQKEAQAHRDKALADNKRSRDRAAKQAAARQAAAEAARPAPAGAGNTAAQQDDYQSPEPEPISYWELPDAQRNSIPEIKFSVLVYAEQPESRFVLINGERLIEGDALQQGLLIKEIRRDGVVFTYQLYQFFVER